MSPRERGAWTILHRLMHSLSEDRLVLEGLKLPRSVMLSLLIPFQFTLLFACNARALVREIHYLLPSVYCSMEQVSQLLITPNAGESSFRRYVPQNIPAEHLQVDFAHEAAVRVALIPSAVLVLHAVHRGCTSMVNCFAQVMPRAPSRSRWRRERESLE